MHKNNKTQKHGQIDKNKIHGHSHHGSGHIDINKTIDASKEKFRQCVTSFDEYLRKIVPNEMDFDGVCRSLMVQGKPLNSYVNVDLLVSKQTTRSLKVEKMDTASSAKLLQAAGKAFTQLGYMVSDQGDFLIATLPQFLGEHREKLLKEMKQKKEEYKQLVNRHRKELMDLFKNVSENEERVGAKKADLLKDEAHKAIESAIAAKEKQIKS